MFPIVLCHVGLLLNIIIIELSTTRKFMKYDTQVCERVKQNGLCIN